MKVIGVILTIMLWFIIWMFISYPGISIKNPDAVQTIWTISVSIFAGMFAINVCEKFLNWFNSNLKQKEDNK